MKTEKLRTLLKVDIYVQVAILSLAISFLFIPNDYALSFFLFFFGLGGIQLISYFIHLSRRLKNNEAPTGYTVSLISVAVLSILTLLLHELIIFYLFIMFFMGVIMAIAYLIITINEFKKVDHEK